MANRRGSNGKSDRFHFWGGSTITTDGDYSHEIKILFLLGIKAMSNLDGTLKIRDIILPIKV